jgi:ribose transport system ATP-binding protein
MAFLDVKQVRKTFPGVVALDDIHLAVDLGTVHVLAGENGAGKSTLIRILTGVMPPDSGSILIEGRDALADRSAFDAIAYVPQELNLFRHMSVAENLFMPFGRSGFPGIALSRAALDRAAQPYLDRFAIRARPGQAAGSIAVSDQQLLQIARAATNKDFKVLILDEPTSSLTHAETDRLFAQLRQLRETAHAIIFVSHKMEEMFALGDRVTVLRNGRSVGHSGMAGIDERGLNRMMSGDEVTLDQTFRPDVAPSGAPILEVTALSGAGFTDVSFSLRKGEILGFAGLVGAGRTELMQTLFGTRKASGGSVSFEGKPWRLGRPDLSVANGMLYLSEERKQDGILPMLSVRENIGISLVDRTSRAGLISHRAETRIVDKVIRDYDIRTSSREKKIRFLSGGNQQKAIIGRAMERRPRLLIFDEPTKGIDIRTKVEIYKIIRRLAEDGIGVILVSSEMAELRRCATRIVTLYHGRLTGSFDTDRTDADTLVAAIIGAGELSHAV